jgi:hypothetical protein
VRSQTERPMAGWAPDDLIRFVEEQTGLAGAARSEPAARDHHVVLDAGKAVGGGRRSVDLTLANAMPADVGEFEYRATLAGRAYGDVARERRWTTIAREAGRGTPAETLPLRFPEVDLPAGIHRLRLDMVLRFENPVSAAPALELV